MKRLTWLGAVALMALLPLARAQTPGQDNTVSVAAMDQGGTVPAASALTSAEDLYLSESDYYLVRGQRIPLRRDAQRMAVKLTKQAREAYQSEMGRQPRGATSAHSAALRDALGFSDAEADVSLEQEVAEKGLVIVEVRPKSGHALGRTRLRDAGRAKGVEYANPVFAPAVGLGQILVTDEILVCFASDYDDAKVALFAAEHGLASVRRLRGRSNTWLLRLDDPRSQTALDVANTLHGQPGVLWAQPSFEMEIRLQSNDPYYASQWHLHNTGQSGGLAGTDVRAPEAWALGVTGSNIVIAIVDSGVDLSHEDLVIWQNPGESGSGRESNGIDDDGNGYVDDYRGWDFYSMDNNPSPGGSHGTACAGVAAARGNNAKGVAGVACGAAVLPIKITSTDTGFANDAAVHDAIVYAADHADILSCSWTYSLSESIMDAIDYAVTRGRGGRGSPVFVAAGNDAARGWTTFGLTGAPAGTFVVGWEYRTDDSPTGALNDAWLDNVTLQDGSVERFSGTTPPTLPSGWSGAGTMPWTTVSDAEHAIGDSRSARAGQIGPDGWSRLYVQKNYSVPGNYSFSCWVGPAAGQTLYALYYYSSRWIAYKCYYGAYVGFPASYSNSIAVGACGNLGAHSSYSQYGPELDLVAPSGGGTLGIVTTDRTGANGYSTTAYCTNFSGTSAATPAAAGVAALVLAANPQLTAAEVKRVLQETAVDMEQPGFDIYTGRGRVNAYAAVMASAANNPPVIESRAPTNALVFVTPGASARFAIGARDPEGTALTYRWYLDGALQASTATNCVVATSSGMVGPHQVRAEVSDRGGNTVQVSWQLLVGEGDPNLVGYWPFDDKTGRDQSGWGNDLSIQGAAGFNWDGIKGPDLDLDVQP
ncbi:MAG TPA: S8 family serine peptidase [Kiritimatiellia bacterium]|nr:S8 family serine peptidase [Kiritimatiellia bacterium]HSA17720.1 S8 family serine peptidase [Kiritimatiellia bacterium]